MFVFNLSCVSPSEVLLSGDLHVYRKRPKSPDPGEAHAHMLLHHERVPLDAIRMRSSKFGWQAYDVTSAVQESRGEQAQKLIVSFRSEAPPGGEVLPLKHFIRHNIALPFLIVFSNDTQNITLDHIDPHFRQTQGTERGRSDEVIIDPEFGVEVPLFGAGRRKRPKQRQIIHHSKTETLTTSEVSTEDEVDLDREQVEPRQRRSIYDNEIPEHPTDSVKPDAPYNVPRTHPGILQGRHHVPRHHVPVTSSEQLIPYPENYEKQNGGSSSRRGRKRKGRKNRKRKDKRGRKGSTRTLPFPDEWDREITHRENTIKVDLFPGLKNKKYLTNIILSFLSTSLKTYKHESVGFAQKHSTRRMNSLQV